MYVAVHFFPQVSKNKKDTYVHNKFFYFLFFDEEKRERERETRARETCQPQERERERGECKIRESVQKYPGILHGDLPLAQIPPPDHLPDCREYSYTHG